MHPYTMLPENIRTIIFDWRGTLVDRNEAPFSATAGVLVELKKQNIRLALISTHKDVERRRQTIQSSGLAHFFDVLIVDTAKTREHFITCLERMNAQPAETLVIDDRAVRGIKHGNALGCTTVWVQKGKYQDELPDKTTGMPDYRIDSIHALLTIA